MAGGGTHPPKRKTSLYSEEQLQNAMQSVQNGMSIREAAETFGIPRSTLGDKLRGKSAPTVTIRGKDPMLSKAVEDRFAEWVIKMANLGFPRSKAQIIEAVKLYLDKANIKVKAFNDNRPGISWFYGFLRRHPTIKMKKAEKLEQARAMACTKESVYAWFDEFEQFKTENNITSEDQVFNCDESGFPLQAGSSMKVLCDKHSRRNFQITSSCKTSITTLQCICANGTVIPPAVLFPGVKFNLEYSIGFPQNFYLGFTQNGWMDTKQFYAWITNHFVKKIPPLRPVVLLIDGHGSHIDYYVSQFCAENQILLFRFPPHTSHAVQPTDRGFFGAFKHNFSKELAKFTVQYPGVSITKRQFPFIFTRVYEISCKMETVKSSFRATGIWPTNRMNVDHNLFNPSKAYQSLEATDNSENDVVNFNVESENDVNNRLLQSTNLKATDCPSISTDNQVETENNPQNFLHEISSQQGELSVICGPSTQQLFPPKQVIAESGASINSEQSSPGNILPNSIPQMVEESFLSLPGGNACIGKNIPSASTPKPPSQHPVQKALKDLENSIGNKRHIFLNRFIEGYDAPGDSLFIAWKALYTDWKQIQESIDTSTYSNESAEDIHPIINSVLTYPAIQRKAKSNKSKAQQLPKHMTTAEALSILQQKEEEKRRKEVIKEARRQKKNSKTSSKNIKKLPKTTKEIPVPSNIPQRKSSRPRKKSRVALENEDLSTEEEFIEESTEELYTSSSSDNSNESSDEDEENNICTECKEMYEEGQFWIKCDVCFKWFHVHCTDQKKRSVSSIKRLKAWKCKHCN